MNRREVGGQDRLKKNRGEGGKKKQPRGRKEGERLKKLKAGGKRLNNASMANRNSSHPAHV